jgi:hypothetical protein
MYFFYSLLMCITCLYSRIHPFMLLKKLIEYDLYETLVTDFKIDNNNMHFKPFISY